MAPDLRSPTAHSRTRPFDSPRPRWGWNQRGPVWLRPGLSIWTVVEAGGIEPPSRDAAFWASTRVAVGLISSRCARIGTLASGPVRL